jgi:hypothetical protein
MRMLFEFRIRRPHAFAQLPDEQEEGNEGSLRAVFVPKGAGAGGTGW